MKTMSTTTLYCSASGCMDMVAFGKRWESVGKLS